MKIKNILILLLLAMTMLLLMSCGSGNNTSDPTSSSTGTTGEPSASPTTATTADSSMPTTTEQILLPPVENNPPDSTYEPAFDGQTRIAGVETATSYEVTVVTQSLNSPWAVSPLPDGRLVITEKAGTIRIVSATGELSQPIGGLPPVDDRGQGGLLDVTPSPDFDTSRNLYFTLAEQTSEGSLTAAARGRLSDDETTVEAVEIIWRAIPNYDNSAHFGSRIVFDEAGNLFVSTGERSEHATRPMAQSLDNGYGKVVHITTDGEPVSDNPFIGQAGVLPEIYAYGLRNTQGLAIHPLTGHLWSSDMGPRGGDELNIIEAGKNYGWPVISFGIEYSGAPDPDGLTAKDGMEQPVYFWDPAIAPSGMTFYADGTIPEWENNLFVGGLSGQHIARLVIDGERVVGEERLLASEDQRFRDVTVGSDGYLYAVTDQGRLYRIG